MTAGCDARGAATVWSAGVIAVLVSVAAFGMYLGAMVALYHAESAADLPALAGAAQLVAGERYACTQARRVIDHISTPTNPAAGTVHRCYCDQHPGLPPWVF